MKTHTLHLDTVSFQLVQSWKKKTIEIRLYDEKRKNIQIGDDIIFEHSDLWTFKKWVVELHCFPSFLELINFYDETFFGEKKEELYPRLQTYYSPEDEKKDGVIAIHLQ